MEGIVVENLHVARGSKTVLAGASLEAGRGEISVVMGPNGSGKTTLLEAVTGVVKPQAGRITIASRIVYDGATGLNLPPEKRRVAYVPQDYGLFPHMSVRDNILLPLRARHRPPEEADKKIKEIAETLGIEDILDKHPGQLSGGQRQKVAIARALAADPDAVLLDEPFSALDAATREKLRPLLRRILHQAGVAALLVTHSFSDAWLLGDRLYFLQHGRTQGGASPTETALHPLRHDAAETLGYHVAEAVSLGNGEVKAEGLGTLKLRSGANPPPGTRLRIAFRSDDITLWPPPGAPNTITATITEVTLTRYSVRLTLLTQHGVQLLAEAPRGHLLLANKGQLPKPGTTVKASIPPEAIDYTILA